MLITLTAELDTDARALDVSAGSVHLTARGLRPDLRRWKAMRSPARQYLPLFREHPVGYHAARRVFTPLVEVAVTWYHDNERQAAVPRLHPRLLRRRVRPPGVPCDQCGTLMAGVFSTADSDTGAISVQRCDACAVYPGDLDAAWALAQRVGGAVWFYQAGTGDLAVTRQFTGTYRPDDCIATGTDPWIEGADLSLVGA